MGETTSYTTHEVIGARFKSDFADCLIGKNAYWRESKLVVHYVRMDKFAAHLLVSNPKWRAEFDVQKRMLWNGTIKSESLMWCRFVAPWIGALADDPLIEPKMQPPNEHNKFSKIPALLEFQKLLGSKTWKDKELTHKTRQRNAQTKRFLQEVGRIIDLLPIPALPPVVQIFFQDEQLAFAAICGVAEAAAAFKNWLFSVHQWLAELQYEADKAATQLAKDFNSGKQYIGVCCFYTSLNDYYADKAIFPIVETLSKYILNLDAPENTLQISLNYFCGKLNWEIELPKEQIRFELDPNPIKAKWSINRIVDTIIQKFNYQPK